MKKLLGINVSANSGSTGRIAEGIGITAQQAGFDSWIAYGRYVNQSASHLIKIGSRFDCYEHGFESRVFDNHGLASRLATISFLKKVNRIKPDLIHLHNIHGYYLNYKILFRYIREKNIPVVWTLHDSWSFTGHCAYFSYCACEKWKTVCFSCSQKSSFPASYFFDRSKRNYQDKLKAFTSIPSITLVSVSKWLDDLVSQSFLGDYRHLVIKNGINTNDFSPAINTRQIRNDLGFDEKTLLLLGVANPWSKRKGLRDFVELSRTLSPQTKIILIGLTKKQKKNLPSNIRGYERTNSTKQLADFYSAADLYLNLTYEDNYPTTNLEAISCGTPCLTYRTGGSPESISSETGFVVPQGDLKAVMQCIEMVRERGKQSYSTACRNYALAHFRQEDRFQEYIDLYKQILQI